MPNIEKKFHKFATSLQGGSFVWNPPRKFYTFSDIMMKHGTPFLLSISIKITYCDLSYSTTVPARPFLGKLKFFLNLPTLWGILTQILGFGRQFKYITIRNFNVQKITKFFLKFGQICP